MHGPPRRRSGWRQAGEKKPDDYYDDHTRMMLVACWIHPLFLCYFHRQTESNGTQGQQLDLLSKGYITFTASYSLIHTVNDHRNLGILAVRSAGSKSSKNHLLQHRPTSSSKWSPSLFRQVVLSNPYFPDREILTQQNAFWRFQEKFGKRVSLLSTTTTVWFFYIRSVKRDE